MFSRHCQCTHRKKRLWKRTAALLLAAALPLTLAGCGSTGGGSDVTPAPAASTQTPEITPTPTPAPTPTPTPTPTPEPAFDFTQPAPETPAVEMEYFSDALFIGDSRTDGLQLYSGIKGATFYCYKGLIILDMQERKVVELGGETLSVVEALGRQQFAKVYISLGVNELGFFDDNLFEESFRTFLRQVKQLQPDAIVYLENLVPVNPDKCEEYNQPYYVTNEQVDAYNDIFDRLAREEQVVLLDVASALSDENGVLARENTVDGVHFTKDWYKTWLDYLMKHTVSQEEYLAGQSGSAAVDDPLPAETAPMEGETENET